MKIERFVIGCEEIVDCIGNQVGRGGVDVELKMGKLEHDRIPRGRGCGRRKTGKSCAPRLVVP